MVNILTDPLAVLIIIAGMAIAMFIFKKWLVRMEQK